MSEEKAEKIDGSESGIRCLLSATMFGYMATVTCPAGEIDGVEKVTVVTLPLSIMN